MSDRGGTCPVGPGDMLGSSPAPGGFPANFPAGEGGVDVYGQALKGLAERSPFDTEEVVGGTCPTLPSALAGVLSKQTDSRRRQKRLNSDTKKKARAGAGTEKSSKSSNIWVELEDYFRELCFKDVERLHCFATTSSLSSLGSNSCFAIPVLRNESKELSGGDGGSDSKVGSGRAAIVLPVKEEEEVGNGHAAIVLPVKEEEVVVLSDDGPASDTRPVEVKGEDSDKEVESGNANGNGSDKQEVKIENGSRDSVEVVVVKEEGVAPESSSQSCSSIEWVLGSRNRVLLATTRPTKKRKLLGENAGLERLMVAQPIEGSSTLCHVCSMGDTGDQLNHLVVCKSCNVVVHQKCYGVQGEADDSWLCSWCKHKSTAGCGHASGSDRPCVLCPKTGGASKRFQRTGSGNEGSAEFAHLFCSQWMPEVFIDDTRQMEPLLTVDGIKDVRGKLVCNLCKIKLGSCVRCSDGSCRTSFHPICAREARNKLEIWGKFGCDDIELRAFCTKHSGDSVVAGSGTLERNEQNHSAGSGLLSNSSQHGHKIKKLKIGCKNGDKVTYHIGAADAEPNVGRNESQEMNLKDTNSNTKLKTESVDLLELSDEEPPERNLSEDVKAPRLQDLALVLKKFLERGKVSLARIASDIGISEDSLALRLTDNDVGPELSCKILKWFRDHAYMNTSEKDPRANLRWLIPSKSELGSDDGSDAVAIRDMNMSDVVPVKSVPPRRRTVGNIRILDEDEVKPLWDDKLLGNGMSINGRTQLEHVNGDRAHLSKDAISSGTEKIMVDTNGSENLLEEPSPASESTLQKLNTLSNGERNGEDDGASSGKSSLVDLDQELPSCTSANTIVACDGYFKPGLDSFVHPYIQKKLTEVKRCLVHQTSVEFSEWKSSVVDQSSVAAVCCNDTKLLACDEDGEGSGVKLEDLHKLKETGILDLCPANEVEGEIIFFQQRLLQNAVALKHHTDQLVSKIVRNLPHEMDAVRKQRWDDVLVNQYTCELKEARKQGRKERRHKEAQAVLAAATAAAAASSRISSMRKDVDDETSQQENPLKVESSRTRGSLSSLLVPRAKDSQSSLDVPKATSDRYPDMFQYPSSSPKEYSKLCDICRRSESLFNPILVCSSCKVAVHLNCYRSVKESTGPWYCELCEESSSSKASRPAVVNSLEKPYPIAECGLCGASNGAFRKSSSGQWVHAFCAEWVFDSTFRRGQVYPVAGMETVLKGNDICSVCHRRYGVCIKCNFGNCQAMFHPSCARSAGSYMYTRYIGGGKMHRKAYCSKHSLEQRAKVETQKHGVEDLKIVKQHRVELEKLRLLCERILKREKLKREVVLCNQDILAAKRDSVAVTMLAHRPFLSHDGSSESATTSLRGHSRSDDVTVDSAFSSKRCIRLPVSIDNDQKTDDSSTSQRIPTPKPTERVTFAGKQIPTIAAMTGHDFSQSGDEMLKSKKNPEIFEKELIMTSDQASMRNRQLPKGYYYVPLDSLSNGRHVSLDSVERDKVDG